MKLEYFTANPKNETNDCAIRSLANALGMKWEDVMREMCDIAIEKYLMPNDERCVGAFLAKRNIELNFQMSNDNTTVEQFAMQHPKGRFYISVMGHALSMIDGTVYDLQDPTHDRVDTWAKVG